MPRPVYSDWYTIHHYVYTDSTGAEYDLDVNTSGVWSSKTGTFIEYDATAKRLYFPGGTFWEFDCVANGTEADAGTLYPTRLVDTNGNLIKVRYQGGLHYGGTNGSARVTEVEDVRAAYVSGVYKTYSFTYNADAIPHLTDITSHIGDGVTYYLTYSGAVSLTDPFAGGSFGTVQKLNTVTVPGSGGLQFAMEYVTGSLELSKVTMPYGGTLEWTYAAKTLAGTRTMMEVQYRKLNAQDGQGTKTYTLYHDDTADASLLAHAYTVVVDASGAADKAYFFNTAADYKLGLFSSLYERSASGGAPVANLRSNVVTWTQTGNGNPYISATVETIDPGVSGVEKASKVEQTVDNHGNMTERKQYGYYTPGGSPTLLRTFTYTYLATSDYSSRHIWNRVVTAKVQKPGGSLITLVTNTYDWYPTGISGISGWQQHDDNIYTQYMIYRGNVTRSVSPGKAVNMTYNMGGAVLTTSDDYGHSVTQSPDSGKNYAVPSSITTGSLSTSFSWNGYMAMTGSTAPNSASSSFSYDSYARPSSTTAANGRVTTYTYHTSPNYTVATTGTRWTKTTVDGFGRAMKVESGYNTGSTPTTVAIVDTLNAPCACTPVGKLWKTSLPYAPGGTVYWTETLYDALGRTVQVKQPNNSGTTTYTYSGPTVKVTDPSSSTRWKKYENDALGNLVKVTEPRPGGGTDYASDYTYSELGQLLTVTMARPGLGSNPSTVTQTRTWVYDSTTQRLTSVTHPESGTTSFTYNSDGSMQRKTDQKGQKVDFAYDSDGRVTSTRRYLTGGSEDTCGRVDYYYGSQTFDSSFTTNATGRLAATATGCAGTGAGQLIEMYSYTSAGALTKKRLRIVRPGSGNYVDKDVSYTYGSDGKLATTTYPGYSVPFTMTYDLMDRPVKMTGPSMLYGNQIDHAKDVVYGVAGQVTSMKYVQTETADVDGSGNPIGVPTFMTETKTYNALFQLTRQTTGTVADIEYTYSSTANNGRITGRKNYVSGEDVIYSYDELNRLVTASISGSGGWGQSFTHDGFGNLWTQAVTKGTAPNVSLSIDQATNRINSSGWGYDSNGNTTSMPVLGGGTATMGFDVDNRMVSWYKSGVGTEEYGYLADNKRVWKKTPAGAETIYFYGAGGQKLVTYTVTATSPLALSMQSVNVYFGGKVIRADGAPVVRDRLGSVVWRSGVGSKDYFPYGDEIGSSSSGNVDKFGTYLRDQTTGLDYADQRYFAGTMGGRFLTSDPYEASGGAGEPGSWNRYPYVGGDPVNFGDPRGQARCPAGSENTCVDVNGVERAGCLLYGRYANLLSGMVQSDWRNAWDRRRIG